MNQPRTAAEIEAQQDEKLRPYSASAAEVAAIANQLKQTNAGQIELSKRLTAEIDRRKGLEKSLGDLEEFTGIKADEAEPLHEVIDTNAEHIGEILSKHASRLTKLEDRKEEAANFAGLRILYQTLHHIFGS